MKKSNNKVNLSVIQGDVGWHPIDALPKGLKRLEFNGRYTVVHGESGNEHVLIGEKQSIELYQDEKTGMHYLKVLEPIEMRHTRIGGMETSEHDPVKLTELFYVQKQEIEYDPFQKMMRKVKD